MKRLLPILSQMQRVGGDYTFSCDVYSMGITMIEMFTKTSPYRDLRDEHTGKSAYEWNQRTLSHLLLELHTLEPVKESAW